MNMDERVRRARFAAAAKTRNVVDLQVAIERMERATSALIQCATAEERRTRTVDRSHVTYSMVAKDAVERSHRLQKTIAELKTMLQVAIVERDSAAAHLGVLEATLMDNSSLSGAGPLRQLPLFPPGNRAA